MFSLITNQAIQECGQMEAQVAEVSVQIAELEYAIRELRYMSGMEESVARLESLHSEMEFEHFALKQMMFGLNKVILSYISCENRICDNGEQNVFHYARRETGENDFSNISDILNGI